MELKVFVFTTEDNEGKVHIDEKSIRKEFEEKLQKLKEGKE
ncbi:MAG: hypothetical protein ACFFG0_40325 [Candidatus Thorarchaeota archaeon]